MSRTLIEPVEHEVLIKKSRFIARAAPAATEDAARAFLEQVGEADANHNCWAWRSDQAYRFDDDGEPSGTAGRPILQAIESQDMDRVVVVVTRYFGGIKLGTGGLARAYGGTAAECLRAAPAEPIVATCRLDCRAGFEAVDAIHQLLERHHADKLDESYSSDGVCFELEIPTHEVEAFSTAVRDATSGAAEITCRDC